MTDTYSTPDDTGELRSSELQGSLGERLGAQAGEAFMGGMRTFTRIREFGQAERGDETLGSQISRLQGGEDLNDLFQPQEHDGQSFGGPRQPVDVPIADAKARIKQRGLETQLTLPDQPTIRQGVLDLMLQHAQERRDYDAALSRGPQGFFPGALGMVTEIGAGMIDPVNLAAFSIPVLGEARWGQMLASAGESLARRAGVKALQGGLQGAVGSAALIPGDWWLHTKDGQDYTMADALKSVVMGAGMGATFHAGFGAFGDVRARARGLPLPGSPEDLVLRGLMHGTHVPAAALESKGLPAEEIPGIGVARPVPSGGEPQLEAGSTPDLAAFNAAEDAALRARHPAEILADLPPAAREDAYRATAADVIAGRPARTAEMLQEAAKEDPRIAESVPPIEAFHGSAHDFDRFDSSKIGAGEGAQSYGHGLYFAENEAVARSYQLAMEDKHLPLDDQKGGVTYKVHIAADREHFLDWDKPLSEQSAHVRERAVKLLDQHAKPEAKEIIKQRGAETLVGQEVHDAIAYRGAKGIFPEQDRVSASQALHEAGIPGIKYLDQGSRTSDAVILERSIAEMKAKIADTEQEIADGKGKPGLLPAYFERRAGDIREMQARIDQWEAKLAESKKPTHNFVVFDDKLIRITHKNGQEVGLDEMKAEQAKAAAAETSGEAAPPPQPSPASAGEGAAPSARPDLRVIDGGKGKADFQKFADGKRAVDDPDEVAASKAAEATPEPQSIEPTKAVSAAEAAAKEADQLVADILPTLSEKERKVFEDALRELKDDKEARDQVVRDGAACLAAAVA